MVKTTTNCCQVKAIFKNSLLSTTVTGGKVGEKDNAVLPATKCSSTVMIDDRSTVSSTLTK